MLRLTSTRSLDRAIQLSVLAVAGVGLMAANTYSYAYRRVLGQSGAGWTNTGVSTSEVALVSIAVPALNNNDSIQVTTLWSVSGTATNSKFLVIRLSTTACVAQQVCSSGSLMLQTNMNATASVSAQVLTVMRNSNTTNAQKLPNIAAANTLAVQSVGVTSYAGALQTNAGSFLNFNSVTSAASTDSITLVGYTAELVSGR